MPLNCTLKNGQDGKCYIYFTPIKNSLKEKATGQKSLILMNTWQWLSHPEQILHLGKPSLWKASPRCSRSCVRRWVAALCGAGRPRDNLNIHRGMGWGWDEEQTLLWACADAEDIDKVSSQEQNYAESHRLCKNTCIYGVGVNLLDACSKDSEASFLLALPPSLFLPKVFICFLSPFFPLSLAVSF